MSTQRRRLGTDQKAAILKRYLVDKAPISDLCDEYGIKPNQIYAWRKILFDNAPAAFHKLFEARERRKEPPRSGPFTDCCLIERNTLR
jgi:transposase-like protein